MDYINNYLICEWFLSVYKRDLAFNIFSVNVSIINILYKQSLQSFFWDLKIITFY